MENRKVLKSGEFLVEEIEAKDIFIPEEFDEEQMMIAQSCRDFLEAEVYPVMADLEKSDRELMKKLLKTYFLEQELRLTLFVYHLLIK